MQRMALLLLAALLAVVTTVSVADAAVTFHDTACTGFGTSTLSCSGKVSGLGNTPVIVQLTAGFVCTTQSGSNSPPGQVQFFTGPIPPSNGQITFGPIGGTGSCHGTQTGAFVAPATLTIYTGEGCALTRRGLPNSNCVPVASTQIS